MAVFAFGRAGYGFTAVIAAKGIMAMHHIGKTLNKVCFKFSENIIKLP